MSFRSCFPLLIAGALCLWAPNADAGGYATARFGGEHGNVASDHTTAIYYNPAGLALTKGTNVYVEGLFVHRSASYDRPQAAIGDLGGGTPDEANAIAANSGKAELSNFLASPFLGVSSDLGTDFMGVGLALYAPFGGQASWGDNQQFAGDEMYPGAIDGSQRWHTISGVQRAIYVTAGGGIRLPGRVSVGLGLNLVSQSLEVLRARNLDGTDDLITPVGGVKEGRALINGSDLSYSIGAGVMWEASDQLRVGLSYQSMPGFGESALEGELITQAGLGEANAPIDTVLLLSLPDIVRAGLTYRVSPTLEVRLSGDYTRWSVFEHHCLLALVDDPQCDLAPDGSVAEANSTVLVAIPRDWNDTFGVRAGASYWLTPGVELFGGVGFDSNAVPDETLEAGLMDMNKVVTSAGARLGLLDGKLLLTGSLTNVLYFSREIAVRDPADAPMPPSLSPDAAGKYSQLVNFLTVGAQYAF